MVTREKRRDHLAEIGSLGPRAKTRLEELKPVVREKIMLQSGHAGSTREIGNCSAVETIEALQPILSHLRADRARYFERHAPDAVTGIRQADLQTFEWRPDEVGSWKTVTLPHYGEPIGPAVSHYRRNINFEASDLASAIPFIRFTGVDYNTHVFLNDEYVGSHEGFFAPFAFDVSRFAKPGNNVLSLRVENDYTCLGESQHHAAPDIDGDKIYAATGPGYDDPVSGWHHCPPGMGIHGKVFLELRPRLHVDDLFIRPMADLCSADIWIEVINTSQQRQAISLVLDVHGDNFKTTVIEGQPLWNALHAGAMPDAQACRVLEAGPGRNFYKFTIGLPDARKWTPETPWLYQARVTLANGEGQQLDMRARSFGMRSFCLEMQDGLDGMPMLNGKRIRLRGANTMGHEQRCVMQGDLNQLREDLLLAKACHMNFLRFTQRPVQEEVYDACDRMGILVQTDLPLFGYLRRNQFSEALRQAQEMERLVRGHPCNILTSYINEPFPDDRKNRTHRHLVREDLERFFRAATEAVHVENPDRVVKPVDGDYNPPTWGLPDNHCYTHWYLGHGLDPGKLHKGFWLPIKPGWHYGCGEFGAEGLDTRDLMERICPQEWLPKSDREEADWSPASIPCAQSWKFGELYFDKPTAVADWIRCSREHQARAVRLMTEALRRDPRNVSLAVHLFIDAWPTGWMKAIVDTQRRPKPAYFAFRDALTPLMVSLRSDRDKLYSGEDHFVDVWVCNDTNTSGAQASIAWQLETPIEGESLSGSFPVVLEDCRPTYQGTLRLPVPKVKNRCIFRLKAALFLGDQQTHQQCHDYEAFPESGNAALSDSESVRFCKDYASYNSDREEMDWFVKDGGQLVLLALPEGTYEICGQRFVINRASLYPRYFVSRATGHPLVEGFQANDFSWWYDPETDRPSPMASSVIRPVPGAKPILVTTNHGWIEAKQPQALVAAEFPCGRGSIIVCQIPLEKFVPFNPVAGAFAARLMRSTQLHETFAQSFNPQIQNENSIPC